VGGAESCMGEAGARVGGAGAWQGREGGGCLNERGGGAETVALKIVDPAAQGRLLPWRRDEHLSFLWS